MGERGRGLVREEGGRRGPVWMLYGVRSWEVQEAGTADRLP